MIIAVLSESILCKPGISASHSARIQRRTERPATALPITCGPRKDKPDEPFINDF